MNENPIDLNDVRLLLGQKDLEILSLQAQLRAALAQLPPAEDEPEDAGAVR